MSDIVEALRATDPRALAGARDAAHRAAQLPARAAIAALTAKEDWSHTSLVWDAETSALVSEAFPSGLRVALGLSPLVLEVRPAGGPADRLPLVGADDAAALSWLDDTLAARGAPPASGTPLSDGLPEAVAGLTRYAPEPEGALRSLSAWYALSAAALERFAAALGAVEPGPTPVRCWPHHFDIATLVRLSASADENAPAIGCGMAPGDGAYDEPYIYVNPWPHLDAAAVKPALPLGRWHTAGFVGAVATGSELLAQPDPVAALDGFLGRAFDRGRAEMSV